METYEVEQEKAPRSTKEEFSTSDEPSGNQALVIDSEWGGALGHDAADMGRLGKKQEFKVQEYSRDGYVNVQEC